MSSENVGSEKHWGSLFEKSLNFMRLFNIFLYFKIKLEKNNFLIGCRNRTIIIPNTYLDMCSTFITTYFVFIITTYFFPKPAISNKRVHYCIMHASVIHLCQPFVLFKKIWTERTAYKNGWVWGIYKILWGQVIFSWCWWRWSGWSNHWK